MRLDELIAGIRPLDHDAMSAARARQDSLTKPLGSLGRLEALAIQIAGITGEPLPQLAQPVIVTVAADHGVVAEGVSAYPQAVTAQMVMNFLRGGAAINVLARGAGARIVFVDVGVAADLPVPGQGAIGECVPLLARPAVSSSADRAWTSQYLRPAPQSIHERAWVAPALISKKIRRGTANLAHGPAMTDGEALAAIEVGAEIVAAEVDRGLGVLALGEMGIGNTTAAAAIAVALTGRAAAEIVGRGAGLDSAGLARKQAAIERALAVNRPDPSRPLDVLAKVGGLEIAALAGATLMAAARRKPVVVDGYPATAAAMIAAALAPQARPYLIAAHRSQENGHQAMLDWLDLQPLLDLGMRLGEGTGAALALPILAAACDTLRDMATFAEAGVATREDA